MKKGQEALADEVRSALAWLESHSTKRTLEGMARYAIPSDNAASPQPAARWVGKDEFRELTGPSVTRRLTARR